MKIDELKIFKNNKSSTLYFEPVPVHDPNAFEKLYARVSAVYPACKEAGNGFEPRIQQQEKRLRRRGEKKKEGEAGEEGKECCTILFLIFIF